MVELSGVGPHGVCTVVSEEALADLIENIGKRIPRTMPGNWTNPELERSNPMGISESLSILDPTETGSLKLCWDPLKLAEAMISHNLLMWSQAVLEEQKNRPLFQLGLELEVGRSTGWYVHANFGSEVWERIKTSDFVASLPRINREIRTWWEDQTGRTQWGQYTTLFEGVDGLTLQVLQPSGGGGLWIAGAQEKSSSGYELHDHNTDTFSQAFAHIYSLCTILKYCRKITRDNTPSE